MKYCRMRWTAVIAAFVALVGAVGGPIITPAVSEAAPSAAVSSLPPCSQSPSSYQLHSELQTTLPWKGHPRLLVRIYCRPGPAWFVSETIDATRSLIYRQPQPTSSDPIESPIGVVGFFSYAPSAVPVVVIETKQGPSGSVYELFADVNETFKPLELLHAQFAGDLLSFDNGSDGAGFRCETAPDGEMTVTQTNWISPATTPGSTAPSTSAAVQTQEWVFSGVATHETGYQSVPIHLVPRRAGIARSGDHCGAS